MTDLPSVSLHTVASSYSYMNMSVNYLEVKGSRMLRDFPKMKIINLQRVWSRGARTSTHFLVGREVDGAIRGSI